MLVGRVIDDEIKDYADVSLFSFADEAVEVFHGAVHGVDGFVVGNVVTEIDLGRREARSDPDSVDT